MGIFRRWRDWVALREKELQLRAFAVGINSSVDMVANLHVVMLDYDVKDLDLVRESVDDLQFFWRLADAFIYRTKNGFHVFFWYDHVPYERLKMIIDYAKYVDPMYKFIGRYYDHKTIRVAGKYRKRDIEFVTVWPGKRTPLPKELERGEMKMKEHIALSRMELRVSKSKSKSKTAK